MAGILGKARIEKAKQAKQMADMLRKGGTQRIPRWKVQDYQGYKWGGLADLLRRGGRPSGQVRRRTKGTGAATKGLDWYANK